MLLPGKLVFSGGITHPWTRRRHSGSLCRRDFILEGHALVSQTPYSAVRSYEEASPPGIDLRKAIHDSKLRFY